MICYRDRSFCSSLCGNLQCSRNYTDEVDKAAQAWWGDREGGAPVAFVPYRNAPECPGYKEPTK